VGDIEIFVPLMLRMGV